jgi:hypothetical protein
MIGFIFSPGGIIGLLNLYIIGCLEECLKYVLLLNFDEQPKYDYIIEELKKAYNYSIIEGGLKPNPNIFKTPIFDWNVRK